MHPRLEHGKAIIHAKPIDRVSPVLVAAGCGGSQPSVKVRAAKEMGTVPQSPLIVGRDGGWSTRLWGHQVFVYGDSFVSKADVNGSSFHSNSFSITGPWSDEALLFTANHKTSDGGWTYDALVQPDYQEESGRVEYVTYSRPNGSLFGSEFALVRVEFE